MGIPALSGQSEGGRGGRWHTLVPGLMKAIDGPKDWKEGPGPPSPAPRAHDYPYFISWYLLFCFILLAFTQTCWFQWMRRGGAGLSRSCYDPFIVIAGK